MAIITPKFLVGSRVCFREDAFRSLIVREWARHTLEVEEVRGRDLRVRNQRTGQSAKIDINDVRPKIGSD